jgi:hypothetical protein
MAYGFGKLTSLNGTRPSPTSTPGAPIVGLCSYLFALGASFFF